MRKARTARWTAMAAALGLALACDAGGGPVDAGDPPVRVDPGAADPGNAADPGAADAADAVVTDVGADPGAELPATDAGVDPSAADPGAPDPGPADPGPPPCNVGEEPCFGIVADGKTCATAHGVGRFPTILNGYRSNPDTADSGNDDDLDGGCWDAGNDVFYRIWLRPGELLNVQMINDPSIDMNLKAYRGTACAADPGSLLACRDDDRDVGQYEGENLQLTADAEGWYTIVLDGATQDDAGKHVIDFALLNLDDPDGCCPY